ncbi:hypothetical protein BC940DRAFT_344380 [Gongronella butleri]|nr:hypothetical protein BC940DRAFT_344380 [Gongronella butleri]
MVTVVPEHAEAQFMEKLQLFHRRQATPVDFHPRLYDKTIDLFQLFRVIVALGGFQQVTYNGKWTEACDKFDLPSMAADDLRSLYTTYLAGYEKEASQYDFDMSDASPKAKVYRETATALRQLDRPPNYARDQQYISQHQSMGVMALGTPAFFDLEIRTRLLLCLQSSLPNEVDWAFNMLVQLTGTSENFNLDTQPELLDRFLPFVEPFLARHMLEEHDGSGAAATMMEFFLDQPDQEQLERVLQVFHILRNYSFLEANLRPIVAHPRWPQVLVACVTRIDSASPLAELMRYALDILENISPHMIANSHLSPDPCLHALCSLLFSKDRTLILGGLRGLTRMAVNEVNERALLATMMHEDLVDRLFQLLLIDDEELAGAALEFIYQYTGLRGSRDWVALLLQSYPGNLVGLLVGYLSYKSPITRTRRAAESIHGIPTAQLAASAANPTFQIIPDLNNKNYEDLDEPFRCLGWLKETYSDGEDTDMIPFKDLYDTYEQRFRDSKPLNVQETFTVLSAVFKQSPEVESRFKADPMQTELVRIKLSPVQDKTRTPCKWTGCQSVVAPEELWDHIHAAHLPAQDGGGAVYTCGWQKCHRTGFSTVSDLERHWRVHVCTLYRTKYTRQAKSRMKFTPDRMLVDAAEVEGVPLTAALVLRNIAYKRVHNDLFLPYQDALAALAMQRPKLSKYIMTVLGEL